MVGLLNVKLCESNNLFVRNSICRCFHAVKSCALQGPPPVSSPTHMRIYHHHHCTLNTTIVLYFLTLIWSKTPQRCEGISWKTNGSQGFCRLLLSGGINFAWISLIMASGTFAHGSLFPGSLLQHKWIDIVFCIRSSSSGLNLCAHHYHHHHHLVQQELVCTAVSEGLCSTVQINWSKPF